MRASLASIFVLTFFCGYAADNWCAEPEVRFNLLTLPSTRAAENRLSAPIQMAYENVTLRAALRQLSDNYGFAYWIDRRVDADRLISLTMRDANVGQCLSGLAKLCDAEMGLVENVVTVAPAQPLASMQYASVRLHDQLSRRSAAADNRAQLRPLAWEILTTPSELLSRIGTAWDFKLDAELPHDLMDAGQLHPCTLSTQLTLLLGGFDKCAVGQRPTELRVVPLPAAGLWQAVYPPSAIPASRLADLRAITAAFPDSKILSQAGSVTLIGSTAAHLHVLYGVAATGTTGEGASRSSRPAALKNRGKPPADPFTEQRITFKKITDQPVGSVLTALGKQMGFELSWDKSLVAADKLVLVTLEANAENLDVILERLAAQSKLAIARQGSVVTISPGQRPR